MIIESSQLMQGIEQVLTVYYEVSTRFRLGDKGGQAETITDLDALATIFATTSTLTGRLLHDNKLLRDIWCGGKRKPVP